MQYEDTHALQKNKNKNQPQASLTHKHILIQTHQKCKRLIIHQIPYFSFGLRLRENTINVLLLDYWGIPSS